MLKFLQRIGKSLMLPVACLPVAGILMGIGYLLAPAAMAGEVAGFTAGGAAYTIGFFLIKAGGALIDNMPWLFAIGVAAGMSDDNDGTAALAGLVSFLMITTLLSTGVVSVLVGGEANPAFAKINNQFVGILAGLIGSTCYNRFKSVKLPDALSFFSGKRAVSIVTALASLVAVVVLFFVWPIVYTGLVSFGETIIGMGSIGAGVYAFFNRLLIPVGLHHALNSVFWFDVAGINDLSNFWAGVQSSYGTGMYMTGFFPFMMFGLPAGCLAMYHAAKPGKKKVVYGLLASAAFCSFFTGVTEPIEFSFMFLAPALYLVHALLAGITAAITVALPIRAGFSFSGGAIDLFLSSFTPCAQNAWMIIPVGIVVGIIYYVVFRFVIAKFNLMTPGREDDDQESEQKITLANDNFTEVAMGILEGCGGKGNIVSIDNCITRLRLEIKDYTLINESKIKASGAAGVMRPSKNTVQVIIGPKVQFVADEFKKLCK
ncbi:MAG: N-acetylglucosamine-specific PTS transporter subunit IIBC [Eubacteriales bacterium]|nr:N-acetylglucosamine-specific PTS transporter subunit IIBC [Eubacteriales bacterium]